MDNVTVFQKGSNYVVYNIARHRSIVTNEIGFSIIRLYLQNKKDLHKLASIIPEKHFETAVSFIKKLNQIDLFSEDPDTIIETIEDIIPQIYYLHLTYKCNLLCDYCYNRDIRTFFHDLPITEWSKVIEKIADYATYIVLTGGEPLLYENIGYITMELKNRIPNVVVEIISNGMVDYSKLEENLFDNIDRITFSCDNFNDNKQLRKGFSASKLINNINWMKENHNNVKLAISSTYYQDNIVGQKEVENYCLNNNIIFRSVLVVPNSICELPLLPNIDLYQQGLVGQKKDVSLKRIQCGAALGIMSVAPDGNVYPCQNLHYDKFRLGNLLTDSIADIVQGEATKLFRKKTKVYNINTCSDCDLKYICSGGCRAATYRLEGDLSAYPKHMCQYYRQNAMYELFNYNCYDLSTITGNANLINDFYKNKH